MRLLFVCLALAGCAKAGEGNSIIGGIDDAAVRSSDGSRNEDIDAGLRPDAAQHPDADPAIDASRIDAPPAPARITLSQTTSPEVLDNNSLACRASTTTPANSYYRVFAPADARGGGTLHVTQVSFGIQDAISATVDGVQPATIRLGVYTGTIGTDTLDLTKVTPLTSKDFQIGDSSLTTQDVAITADVPGSAQLIVELALPANDSLKNQFFLGSNDGGETEPAYLRASTCSFSAPTSLTTVTDSVPTGPMDALITVTGTL